MKIVITAPSLDEHRNVSGISTVVRQIIEYSGFQYAHFTAGREDGEKAGPSWLLKQAALPIRFFSRILREKADLIHINTALTDLSIWRDAALTYAAKLSRRPIVLTIHGGKFLTNDFESIRLERTAERMLRRAKAIVVLSNHEKHEIEKRWSGLNIKVLPNAIPSPPHAAAIRNNSKPVIIFFGRLHESKGLDEIVKASRTWRWDIGASHQTSDPQHHFLRCGDRFAVWRLLARDHRLQSVHPNIHTKPHLPRYVALSAIPRSAIACECPSGIRPSA